MDILPLPDHPLADNPQFGRMFPNLPPWTPPAGVRDVDDYLFQESERLYLDLGELGAENPSIPAGYTYLGQFINHDITFDATSSLRHPAQPHQLRSKRTPRFDLDSLYGGGPREQPFLYCGAEPGRLLLGQNENGELDLPRNRDVSRERFGTRSSERWRPALIGDPRNDDNILLSQLHLAFMRFHNARLEEIVAHDHAKGRGPSFLHFARARRVTQWHYQWIVVHDFLERFCGAEEVERLLHSYGRPSDRCFAFDPVPFVPVEFSLGVFRSGHSIVSPSYHLNDVLFDELKGAEIEIFGPEDPSAHLGGGRELPEDWSLQWDRFVPLTERQPKASGALDTRLPRALRELPIPAGDPRERSLAYRTLKRSWLLRIPSGQSIARALDLPVPEDLERGEDPLWVYVLREAETAAGGRRLGPLGAKLAASVVVAFLMSDPESFLRLRPDWKPSLAPSGERFELADFLRHAGVPTSADDWREKRAAEPRMRGSQNPRLPING